jgi:hypothetical protein
MYKAFQSCVKFRDTCFEILGFDILLDRDYNPWLLEVNTSPSFATDSQLDFDLKSKVLTEAFNIIGVNRESEEDKVRRFKLNTKLESFLSGNATRLRKKQLDKKDVGKSKRDFLMHEIREELNRCEGFKMIFPCADVDLYSKYFEEERANNKIIKNEIAKRLAAKD